MDLSKFFTAKENISVIRKLYISDKDDNWIDFSNKSQLAGTNRLISYGSIDVVIERTFRHFYNKTSVINLRNDDGFFDTPFPTTGSGWKLMQQDGTTVASFLVSSSGAINIFSSKLKPTKIRLAVEVGIPGHPPTEFVLGTFLLTKIGTASDSEIASLTVDSITKKLQKTPAEFIKDGFNNWYRSIPISFLVRKVLEKAFGSYNATTRTIDLPSGFKIPKFKDLILSMPESVFSNLGRSPNQLDSNADGEPDTFPQYGLIPTASVYYATNNSCYLGLSNELWRLDLTTMLWSQIYVYATSVNIRKMQIFSDKIYLWTSIYTLHQINDATPTTIYDADLRKDALTLYVYNITAATSTSLLSQNIYDTEFNYFNSLLYRCFYATGAVNNMSRAIYYGLIGNWSLEDADDIGYSGMRQLSQVTGSAFMGTSALFKRPSWGGGSFIWGVNWSDYLVGGNGLPSITGHQYLNNSNLPIPFKQRIFCNFVDDNGFYANDMPQHALQIIKLPSLTAKNNDDSALIDERKNENIVKETKYEVGAGYYALAGLTTVAASNVNVGNGTTVVGEITNYANLRDVKFTFGQFGLQKLIKDTAGTKFYLLPTISYVDCQSQEMWASFYYSTSPVISGRYISNRKAAIVTLPFCGISLRYFNASDVSTTVYDIPKLHYKGMELQPTDWVLEKDESFFYLMAYCNSNMGNRGLAYAPYTSGYPTYADRTLADEDNFAGVATEALGGYPTQKQQWGLVVKLWTTKDYNYNLKNISTNTDIINLKTWDSNEASNYANSYNNYLSVTKGTLTAADYIDSIILISDGVATEFALYIYTVEEWNDAGTLKFKLWARKWGLYFPSSDKTLIPFGDFRNRQIKMVGKIQTVFSDRVILESVVHKNTTTNTKWVYYAGLRLDEIGLATQYFIGRFNYVTGASIEKIIDCYAQPKNLVISSNNRLYYTLEGIGKTCCLDINLAADTYSGIANTLTFLSNSAVPVNDEPFTNGNITVVSDATVQTADIVGFTSPAGNIRSQLKVFNAKYYTWRLGTSYYPLIEMADFSGMFCDDVLDKLAESIYWTKGFDEYGNFFQIKRELETNPSVTLDLDNNSTLASVKKEIDYDTIANKISIIPYKGVFKQPSFQITQRKRNDKEGLEISIDIEQRDSLSKSITLICVSEGFISVPVVSYSQQNIITDYTIQLPEENFTTAPLFKYAISDPTIEAEIGVVVAIGATLIYLKSVFGGDDKNTAGEYINEGGIHVGDYLKCVDTAGVVYIRRITTVTNSTNSIVIDSSLPFQLNAETVVNILRAKQRYFSDDYVTVVKSIDATGTKIEVEDYDNIPIKAVIEVTQSNGITVKSIVIDKETDSANKKYLRISTTFNSGLIPVDTVVRAYWAPFIGGKFYQIGGTNVFMSIAPNESSALDTVVADTKLKPMSRTFLIGESITITCEGLKLEQDNFSSVNYNDATSISLYGEIQFPNGIDNKFVNGTLALFLAKKLIDENASPKYDLDVDSVFLPYITAQSDDKTLLRKIRIISKKLFSKHLDNAVDGSLLDIKHTVDKRTTNFSLRGEMKLD